MAQAAERVQFQTVAAPLRAVRYRIERASYQLVMWFEVILL
jgi:hypothetical protein